MSTLPSPCQCFARIPNAQAGAYPKGLNVIGDALCWSVIATAFSLAFCSSVVNLTLKLIPSHVHQLQGSPGN